MARITKKTTTQTEKPVEVVEQTSEVVQNVVEPSKQKKVKKSKDTTEKSVSETPVVSLTVETKPSESSESEQPVLENADVENQITEQSVEFHAKLQQLSVLISTIKSEFKQLEKKYQKDLKIAQKNSNKKKRKVGNRAPSGFVKPTRISDELAAFLDKPVGTEMARTAVTRDINAYIRANKLQDKENGRRIIPDKKLASLLKIDSSEVLTYFNLQKYMSSHFAKTVKNVEQTATA